MHSGEWIEKQKILQRYFLLRMEVRRLEGELERVISLAERVSPSYAPAPGGGSGNRIAKAVERLVDARERLAAEVVRCEAQQAQAMALMESVADVKLRLVLQYRYCDGMRWEEIAQRLHYDPRHVRRLHDEGIEAAKMS